MRKKGSKAKKGLRLMKGQGLRKLLENKIF